EGTPLIVFFPERGLNFLADRVGHYEHRVADFNCPCLPRRQLVRYRIQDIELRSGSRRQLPVSVQQEITLAGKCSRPPRPIDVEAISRREAFELLRRPRQSV